MTMSHIKSSRPSEMSQYLLMELAMMSVPPVLPPARKMMARPSPSKKAPMTQAMNFCSPIMCMSFGVPFTIVSVSCVCIMLMANEMSNVTMIVRTR